MQNFNNFLDKKMIEHLRKKGIHIDPSSVEHDREKRMHDAELKATREYMKNNRRIIFNNSLFGNSENINKCFDDFNVTDDKQNSELEQAISIAKRIENGERHKFIFYGKPGTGKTMLAISILNKLKYKYSCLFVDIAQFIELTKNFNDERAKLQANSLYKAMKNTDVLVIDDLGSESSMQRSAREASDYNQRILFNIAQSRDDKTTIITTNNTGAELRRIYNPKLISKLIYTDPSNVISFNSSDYRLLKN